MTNPRAGFDPVAVVVDWLDACKGGRLHELLELYDAAATIECACTNETHRGRPALEAYWQSRLAAPRPGAFGIDDLLPDGETVLLDFRSHDGNPVRMRFRFNQAGRIVHTSCRPQSPPAS